MSARDGDWKGWMRHCALDQMISGVVSGGLATCILHPLDLVKTQFQVQTTARSDLLAKPHLYTLRYLQDLKRQFGVRHGLYQGLSANLAGSTVSWGLYFFLYDWTKTHFPTNSRGSLSTGSYFLASSAAAAVTVLFTNPLWMVKTRLCMQTPGVTGNYHGLWDALTRIARDEGIRGLYRGLVPGLFGVSHGAVQFMVYEELKNWHRGRREARRQHDLRPSAAEYLCMSSVSKTVAMLVTYPYQVVRSRLQIRADSGARFVYSSIRELLHKTIRGEGVWALYRGIVPSTIRVLPGTCITFLTYEKMCAFFRSGPS